MTEDEVLSDMQRTLSGFYRVHKGDREAYKLACEAKADEKLMPNVVKESFVNFALQVYDEMEKG